MRRVLGNFWFVWTLSLGAALAMAWWGWGGLWARAQAFADRTFQTSGIPETAVSCTLPTEHEQLVIVIAWQDRKLRHRCMYVGSRGTYSPKAKGTTL